MQEVVTRCESSIPPGPLISLSEVPNIQWLPRRHGKPIHLATIYRWATRGVGGRKLRTWRAGGTLCTCEQAVAEFFEVLAEPVDVPAARTPSRRRRDIERAARELAEAGI